MTVQVFAFLIAVFVTHKIYVRLTCLLAFEHNIMVSGKVTDTRNILTLSRDSCSRQDMPINKNLLFFNVSLFELDKNLDFVHTIW